jgi:hypothetical protein
VNTEADTALNDYDGPTNAELNARTLPSASYFDPATDPIAVVTTLADGAISACAFATTGTITAVAGQTISLSGGVTANDQWNGPFAIRVYDPTTCGMKNGSDIVDTVNGSPDQVVTLTDISSFIAVNDLFDVVQSSGDSAATIWAYATRALTDKAGFALTAAEKDDLGFVGLIEVAAGTTAQLIQVATATNGIITVTGQYKGLLYCAGERQEIVATTQAATDTIRVHPGFSAIPGTGTSCKLYKQK